MHRRPDHVPPRGVAPHRRPRTRDACIDGLITYLHGERSAAEAGRAGCPVVNVSASHLDAGFPSVTADNHEIGRMAAEHFLGRGHRSFGFVGTPSELSRTRRAGMLAGLAAEGEAPWPQERVPEHLVAEHASHADRVQALAGWLRMLPDPVAVLAETDAFALLAVDACQRAGLAVPDRVALLGVNNDDLLCELSEPRISSIDSNFGEPGWEAASMLHALMEGKELKHPVLRVSPGQLIARASSSSSIGHDVELARAIRFLREHAVEGITVDDVLGEVAMSRRTLEVKCLAAIGRSPGEEIRAVRLQQAVHRVTRTADPLISIAARCGYPSPARMTAAFRAAFGLTPGLYRERHQPPGAGASSG